MAIMYYCFNNKLIVTETHTRIYIITIIRVKYTVRANFSGSLIKVLACVYHARTPLARTPRAKGSLRFISLERLINISMRFLLYCIIGVSDITIKNLIFFYRQQIATNSSEWECCITHFSLHSRETKVYKQISFLVDDKGHRHFLIDRRFASSFVSRLGCTKG